MSAEKRRRVLEAAQAVFMRYGYKRVTMGDIAKEAGMSRPALYLVFQCKPEIFKAVVSDFSRAALDEIRSGIAGLTDRRSKLEHIFEIWSIRPYETFFQTPDAKELVDVSHDVAGKVVSASYDEFEKLLASVFEADKKALGALGLTPPLLARILSLSSRGFKEGARDRAEFRTLIGGMINTTLATLGPPAAGSRAKQRAG